MTRTLEAPIEAPDTDGYPDEITLVVTHDHIRRGVKRQGKWCAMALAFHELGYSRVSVSDDGHAWVFPADKGGEYWCADAEAWVQKFDAGRDVHPERFIWRRRSYP